MAHESGLQKRLSHEAAIPDIQTKDFPSLLRQLVGWNVQAFAELSADLERLRLLGENSVVEHTREYGDILDRLDQSGRSITRLIQAAATLGVDMNEQPPPEARALLAEKVAGIIERMDLVGNTDGKCNACGQPLPVRVAPIEKDDYAADPG